MDKTLRQKLLEVQAMNLAVPKTWFNKHFGTKYRKLEDILIVFKPILHEKGILVYVVNDVTTSTLVMYDTITNEKMESTIRLPETQDPQKIGWALTYFMRYNLLWLLGIEGDEDKDGEEAKKKWKDWQGTENRLKVIEFIKINYGTKNNKEIQDKLSELRCQQTDLKTYTEAEAKNDLLKLMALTK